MEPEAQREIHFIRLAAWQPCKRALFKGFEAEAGEVRLVQMVDVHLQTHPGSVSEAIQWALLAARRCGCKNGQVYGIVRMTITLQTKAPWNMKNTGLNWGSPGLRHMVTVSQAIKTPHRSGFLNSESGCDHAQVNLWAYFLSKMGVITGNLPSQECQENYMS